MYHFFNRHLGLKLPEPVIEEDFSPLSIAEMTVWDEAHPKPPSGGDYERSLVKFMTDASDRQIAALTPSDATSLAKFRDVVGGGVENRSPRPRRRPQSSLRQDAIEVLQPETRRPGQRPRPACRVWRCRRRRRREIPPGPSQRHPRPADDAALDFFEIAGGPGGGPGVIHGRGRPLVHLLHERSLGVNHAVRLEHAHDLGNAPCRVGHVFVDRLRDHAIERVVFERNIVGVENHGRSRTPIRRRFHDLQLGY